MKSTGRLVESANELTIDQLLGQYCPEAKRQMLLEIETTQDLSLQAEFVDARTLTAPQLSRCLDLVERTSAEDYRNSENGWSRSKKRREMKLPDLRYVLLSAVKTEEGSPDLAGFTSFMITYEDGHEVVYIYEIHFAPFCQGKGLGKTLMSLIEVLGANVGMRKSMLTVFKSNTRAAEWYNKLGYIVDEFSPSARRLRGGKIKEPTYVILSKQLQSKESAIVGD